MKYTKFVWLSFLVLVLVLLGTEILLLRASDTVGSLGQMIPVFVGFILLVGLSLFLVVTHKPNQLNKKINKLTKGKVVVPEYDLSEETSLQVAMLLYNQKIKFNNLLSGIINLHLKKILTITPILDSAGDCIDLEFQKITSGEGLSETDAFLFKNIFIDGDEAISFVSNKSKSVSIFSRHGFDRFSGQVFRDARELNFTDPSWPAQALICLLISFLLGGLTTMIPSATVAFFAFFLFTLGVFGIAIKPLLSEPGVEQLTKVLGYKNYLIVTEQDKLDSSFETNNFNKYFPALIAFGLVDEWYKKTSLSDRKKYQEEQIFTIYKFLKSQKSFWNIFKLRSLK